LEIRTLKMKPDDPAIANSLSSLAGVLYNEGRFAEAEETLELALKIRSAVLPPSDRLIGITLTLLGQARAKLGRNAAAEEAFRAALANLEPGAEPGDRKVMTARSGLVIELKHSQRAAEAVPIQKQVLAATEVTAGPESPEMAMALGILGQLEADAGHEREAVPHYQQALAILKARGSWDDPGFPATLNNLAEALSVTGKHAEAEKIYMEALENTRTAGEESPETATVLHNLSTLYQREGRIGDARKAEDRAREILEARFGKDAAELIGSYINLGALLSDSSFENQWDEAEQYLAHAVGLATAFNDQSELPTALLDLANLFHQQGRDAEAELLLRRALTVPSDPDSPVAAHTSNGLAEVLRAEGRLDEAQPFYTKGIEIIERAYGPQVPDLATFLDNLAGFHYQQQQWQQALAAIRRASAIVSRRAETEAGSASASVLKELAWYRDTLRHHAVIAADAAIAAAGGEFALAGPDGDTGLVAEGFAPAQLARSLTTATAVAQMAARFAAGGDTAATLLRERQDLVAHWQALDSKLTARTLSGPDKARNAGAVRERSQLEEAAVRIQQIDAKLMATAPKSLPFAFPAPVTLTDAQALLRPGEALLAYLVGIRNTYLWALTTERAAVYWIPVGHDKLEAQTAEFRRSISSDIPGPGRFKPGLAYEIYRRYIAPAEPLLNGVTHLIVVPDAGLSKIPFGALATLPFEPVVPDADFFRGISWLADRVAITILPAVSALKDQRRTAGASTAPEPFIGFGDPVLDASSGLPALPDTATELKAIAASLGAGLDDLFLRERASRDQVLSLGDGLRRYRVLAFATHALGADQNPARQPALVLSDAPLTVTDIATLKLDADWVILSGCYTAAPNTAIDTESLSGLARAFFFAGARSLLVSQWPVDSSAAALLTPTMLSELAAHPGLTRAEALQAAMKRVRDESGKPLFAEPYFWAPFMVVGD
jgi:CHAT domain-containing protein/Tfp pilus assembly protein PilF